MNRLHEISGCDNAARKADVVFIHGLGGDAFGIWRHGTDEATSWPHWLGSEFPDVGIWSLGYAASATRWAGLPWVIGRGAQTAGHSMPLTNRAAQVLNLMVQKDIGERPLMFVGHSLGGLVAKQILRTSNDSADPASKDVAEHTRAVLFLGTPHGGSYLATLLHTLRTILRTTVSIEDLRENDPHLLDLNEWYRANAPVLGIKTVTYFETIPARFLKLIVNATSSHPGVGDRPIPLDEDHRSIAKPRDKDAQVYVGAKSLLKDFVLAHPPTPAVPAVHRTGSHLVRAGSAPADSKDLERKLHAYLDRLVAAREEALRARYVALAGQIETRVRSEPSPLDDFVGDSLAWTPTRQSAVARILDEKLPAVMGLHLVADAKPVDSEVVWLTREPRESAEEVADVCSVLASLDRAVLLGEPGSGKSWTLARLAVVYADAFDAARVAGSSDAPIPVIVPLRSFNGTVGEGDDRRRQSFEDFALQKLDDLQPHVNRLLQEGRLVFLCDGLNEMPRTSPLDDRPLLDEVIEFLKGAPRFVVSCRTRDYLDDLGPLGIRDQLQLRDLDPLQIRAIIVCRYADEPETGYALWAKMSGSDELLEFWQRLKEAKADDEFWDRRTDWGGFAFPGGSQVYFPRSGLRAWEKMHDGVRLIPLARNPYLLDIVCQIFDRERDLPGNRGGLFDLFVSVLLSREEDQATTRGQVWPDDHGNRIRAAMVNVAAAMQDTGSTMLTQREAVAAVGAEDAVRLIEDAAAASILTAGTEGWSFSHQLLQEHFAVQIVLAGMEGAEAEAKGISYFLSGEGWWDPGPWRETLVILGEFLNERAIGPNRVARWLADASPEVALDVIRRNGEGLTIDDVEPETREALVESAWQRAGEPDPRGRAAAWRVLSDLGADDRPGVGLRPDGLPDIVRTMCRVEPGAVVIDKGVGWRVVEHPYRMARYPVTHIQYQAFVEALDGYRLRWWWDEPLKLAQRQSEPGNQAWPIDNHPAEHVSWYDAMAFCRWLTAKLSDAETDGIDADVEVRLPTEAEWQLAAAGPEGWEYPWGPKYEVGRANVNESRQDGGIDLKRTTAVGIYPDGAADHGEGEILDLTGNVWEWTLSDWGSETGGRHVDLTKDWPRVVRGGSWYFLPNRARAALREDWNPLDRRWFNGFRVVLGRPIP